MYLTPLDCLSCDEHFIVRNPNDLSERLESPNADIVIMPQDQIYDLADIVRAAPTQEKRLTITGDKARHLIENSLREMGIVHASLTEDMIRSIELFATLFGQTKMEIRWEVTDRQSCPKFHCDNVYVRMLVTYHGPTTEFLDQNQSDLVHRAPLNALVFLKGHKHPTYQDRVLHRSPNFSAGEKRLCMIVNFCDWLPNG
jgi:hypothetical protein